MNLTKLILFETVFALHNLTIFFDKILISNKFKHIVLIYSEHSLDSITSISKCKYTTQKTFRLINESKNKSYHQQLRNLQKDTLIVYLINFETLDIALSGWKNTITNSVPQIFIFDKNTMNTTIQNASIKENIGWNRAFVFWDTKDPYVLTEFTAINFVNISNAIVQTKLNIYDDLFNDNFKWRTTKIASLCFYTSMLPPRIVKTLGAINNTEHVTGSDLYLMQLFGKILHYRTKYVIRYINLKSVSYIKHKTYMQNFVYEGTERKFNYNRTEISVEFVQIYYEYLNNRSNYIYPHDYEEYVIIVPNDLEEKSAFVKLVLNSPLLNVWTITIVVVSLFRIYLRRNLPTSSSHVIRLILDTFSIAFTGFGFIKTHIRHEHILSISLSVFSLVSSIFCTGYIFQQYTSTVLQPKINSITDLNNSNLDIVVQEKFTPQKTINQLVQMY